jgi:hypothetical protein
MAFRRTRHLTALSRPSKHSAIRGVPCSQPSYSVSSPIERTRWITSMAPQDTASQSKPGFPGASEPARRRCSLGQRYLLRTQRPFVIALSLSEWLTLVVQRSGLEKSIMSTCKRLGSLLRRSHKHVWRGWISNCWAGVIQEKFF